MLVVFDLDGTLSDPTHREHFVRRPVGQKDWDSFFAEQINDPPKSAMVELISRLHATHQVEIWTGRPIKYREDTIAWLHASNIPYYKLRMRPANDKTDDHEMKRGWCERYGKPDLVFEDRQRLVDMYRSLGITCCQVAPGDF